MRSVTWQRVALLGVVALPLLAACGRDGDDTSAAGSRRSTSSSTDRDTSSMNKASTTTTAETTTAPSTTTATTAPPAPPTTARGGEVQATITLTIEVTTDGQALRSGTLSCGPDGASGTGHLADPAAAQAACEQVQGEGARGRLLNGPDPDRICTMIYGGPEVARVTGQIDGQRVDTTFDRTDGCAIAEWDGFAPVVGPAQS